MVDYENFQAAIADLDRRLASIVCQGFDDCSGLEASFKVSSCISSCSMEFCIHPVI